MRDTTVQFQSHASFVVKMAALFPSERSTKDVINSILDDYEKFTKYFPFYIIFLAVILQRF